MAETQYRYKAFISYSRTDADFARNLHQRLESYVLPVASRKEANGSSRPRRPVNPVFRDEGELVPGGSLPQRLREAVADSAKLILVCSPDAAQRQWVDSEIRFFLENHSADQLICVVRSGEPGSIRQGDGQAECFSPCLIEWMAKTGEELLWIDARQAPRLSRMNLLRVVAAATDLRSIDDLVRRDAARRRRRSMLLAAVAAAFVLILLGSSWLSRRDAALKDADNLERLAEAAGTAGDYDRAGRFVLRSIALRRAYFSQAVTPVGEALMRQVIAMSQLRFNFRGRTVGSLEWKWASAGNAVEFVADEGHFRYLPEQDKLVSLPPLAEGASLFDGTDFSGPVAVGGNLAAATGNLYTGIRIRVTSIATGKLLLEKTFPATRESPRFVGQPSSDAPEPRFSADARSIALCGIRDCVSWSIAGSRPDMVFRRETVDDTLPLISPSGGLLAFEEGQYVRVVDFRTSTQLMNIRVGDISAFDFSPDSRFLMTGDQLGDLRIWEIPALPPDIALYSDVRLDPEAPPRLALSLDGQTLYGTGGPEAARVRIGRFSNGVASAALPAGFDPHAEPFALARPGLLALQGLEGTRLARVSASGMAALSEFPADTRISPRGDFLLVPGSATELERVLDLDGRTVFQSTVASQQLWDVSPDGKLVLASSGREIAIIDAGRREPVWKQGVADQIAMVTIHWPSRGVSILNDGLDQLTMTRDGKTVTARLAWVSQLPKLVFSADGSGLAVVHQALTHFPSAPVELWSPASGASLGIIQMPRGEANANGALFPSTGKFLITYNTERITVWDVATALPVASLIAPPYLHEASLVGDQIVSYGGTGIALRQPLPRALGLHADSLADSLCRSALQLSQQKITAEDALFFPALHGEVGKTVCG